MRTPLALAAVLAALAAAPASATGLPTGAGHATYTYPHVLDGGLGIATCAYTNGVLWGVGTASSVLPGEEGAISLTCSTYDRTGVLVTRTTGHAAQPPVVAGPKTVLDEYPFTVCIEEFVAHTRAGGVVQFQGVCAPIAGAHEG